MIYRCDITTGDITRKGARLQRFIVTLFIRTILSQRYTRLDHFCTNLYRCNLLFTRNDKSLQSVYFDISLRFIAACKRSLTERNYVTELINYCMNNNFLTIFSFCIELISVNASAEENLSNLKIGNSYRC